MLISMRHFGGKWVLGIFSFLIIASFGFWGIGDVIRGIVSRSSLAIVTVADIEISDPEIRREFSLQIARLQPLFGNQLDSAQAIQLGVLNQSIDMLIVRMLYDLEGARLGLSVSDATLRDDIRDSRLFTNARGEFDANFFASFLASQRMAEETYLAIRRNEIIRGQLAGSVAGAAQPTSFLVDKFYRYEQERRIAEFAIIANAAVTDIPEPTNSNLAEYHRVNADQYTAPAYRALSYIHIKPEDIIEEISVSDYELESEYDDRLLEFKQPERRAIDQIVAVDETAARAIHDRLLAGGDFATVALEMTAADPADLSLGSVSYNELIGDMADVIFALNPGAISKPVETGFGWHIFRLTAIEPARTTSLDEVRDQLTHDMALARAADALYDFANQLDDKFAAGASIDEAADDLALPFMRIAAVDADGYTPDGMAATALPAGPRFLTTAFTTDKGQTSLVIEAEDGSEFVVRVDAIIEPALRPLDDVRQAVRDAWISARRDEAASARAEAAADRVAAGESFAQVISDLGLAPITSDPVRRDGDGAGVTLSNKLVAALFSLGANGAAAGATRDGQGYAVIRLAQTVAADAGADSAGYEAQQAAIRDGITRDLMDQYRAHLEQRYPVTVNMGALEALF